MGCTISEEVLAKATDGPIAKHINRRVSSKITKLILKRKIPITPNQMSAVSFLFSLFSAIGFAVGVPALGGIAAQISSIVDGVDGELARARKIETKSGAFLDSMLDRYADILITASAALFSYKYFSDPWSSILPILAITGALLVSYLHIRSQYDLGIHPTSIKPSLGIASRDVRIFLIMVGGVLDHLVPGALTYSVLVLACVCHAYVVFKLLQILTTTTSR